MVVFFFLFSPHQGECRPTLSGEPCVEETHLTSLGGVFFLVFFVFFSAAVSSSSRWEPSVWPRPRALVAYIAFSYWRVWELFYM